jgi:uridine kinase
MVKHRVTFENGEVREIENGTALMALAEEFKPLHQSVIVAARVDNSIRELTSVIDRDCGLKFLDLSDSDGARIYERSLAFMLVKAVNHLYPDRKVKVKHSVGVGFYADIMEIDRGAAGDGDCGCEDGSGGDHGELLLEEIEKIENYMRFLSKQNIPFIRKTLDRDDAMDIFRAAGRYDLYNSIKARSETYAVFYDFDGMLDYFYGYMAPHSGYVSNFALIYQPPGLVVLFPNKYSPLKIPSFKVQPKLTAIFTEYHEWGRILGVENVGSLNELAEKGETPDVIRIAEALQEKKIAHIADLITDRSGHRKIVFISGPSSSGKTTFANRLSIQLRVNGYKTHAISMDDYYLSRELIPRDEQGDYDFENPEALDLDLFISQMCDLVAGKPVQTPIYKFTSRTDIALRPPITASGKHIIIVEGIHGMNTRITSHIPKDNRFKIYVSALTALSVDDHNRIPTTDTRLIRRIVRDYQFRGISALSTLMRWQSVRRGEKKFIFPYQETCDIMFNSALIYELGILKSLALPLLEQIGPESYEYSEAIRLIKFLHYFAKIDHVDVPKNSILREFIGGSCFEV